jgi:hypothetical protein
MDFNGLMASFLFGIIGMGMFMYGKKAGRLVPLSAGLGLMVVPYFIPNLWVLLTVCGGLSALPFMVREG